MHKTIAVLISLVLLGACSSDSGSQEPAVSMTAGHVFDPDSLTVSSGTEVTWTNDDDEPHTVTAYDGEVPEGEYFSSGDLPDEAAARDSVAEGIVDPGETYSFTFDEPGTYSYFCIPHEDHGMVGEIVVEE
ncbi:MAG: plastocyanin/azurin family copper-binding protein [Actinomycetota bacterium]|nr:plastocyanin/azurin family copper-binding protein [Actinomycetota bacterium]